MMIRESHNRTETLHERVRAKARQVPDAIAAVYGDEWITYGELVARSACWAAHLRRLGVHVGTRVGLHLERSLELPAIVLAVLEAGGICVPLEPSHPPQTLSSMIREANLSIILSESRVHLELPTAQVRTVLVDEQAVAAAPAPETRSTCEHLAFVLFTSGSTGVPKGVMITHAAIAARMFRGEEDVPEAGRCMAIMKTAISHSPFIGEMFASLLHGCYFVIARPGGHQDVSYLGELIIKHRVSHIAMTSAVLRAFLDWPGVSGCCSLKSVYVGGESVSEELRRRFFECFRQTRFVVTYGTSEAGHNLSGDCGANERLDDSRIGRPIENAEAHLLGPDLERVESGEAGEMYLGGPRLASGYLDRPAWTAERFMPHPYAATPGDRLFRSGDLAQLRPDGEFQFKGRTDQQVKILGNRVELSEIEAAIAACPGIREAIVTARANDRGETQLVAYVVADDKSGSLTRKLRDRLTEQLPLFMVPYVFVRLDSFPLTVNGKVDRLALPEPSAEASLADDDSSVEAADLPRDDAETLATTVFERYLEIERLGIYDDFFALGGHSLLAVEVITEINRLSNANLGVVELIRNPTAEKLGKLLRGAIHEQGPSLVPLCDAPGTDNLFCILGIQIYHDLARALKASPLSVYAILGPVESQVLEMYAKGITDTTLPPVEDIARQYVDVIREVQPSGPYHLLGHSFGGVIAVEIARQLKSQGQQTRFIGLLDCTIGGASRLSKTRWVKRRIRQLVTAPTLLLGRGKLAEAVPVSPQDEMLQRISDGALQAQQKTKVEWAKKRYQYSGPVTLIRATDEDRTDFVYLSDYGWKDYIQGRIDTWDIPGDHLTMLKLPNVQHLADLIVGVAAAIEDGVALNAS